MGKILEWFWLIALLAAPSTACSVEIPLHPDEARVVEQILSVEGHTVEQAEIPGWSKGSILSRLKDLGIEAAGLNAWGVRDKTRHAISFNCIYDSNGRTLALMGNGPWLRDESLRSLKAMTELRIIRFDHNGYVNSPLSPLYSGVGFDALSDSKIVDIKLTLGISNAGMEQAAKIKGLKSFAVVHSRVADAGLTFFEGHPSLESFTVAEMGNVSQAALASVARMPHVQAVGFQEAFVAYEGGFEHLASMKGRLKSLDLSMSVVNAADLERVQADHPAAKITIISPAEIVKRHRYVAAKLAGIATGDAAEELKQAIATYEAEQKSAKSQ